MIRVEPQPEPPGFEEAVRRPGQKALDEGRDELPRLWSRCAKEMLEAYGRICAYSCLHIARVTGGPTVEHFAPKSKRRELAYEWSNYRLVCALMNSRKRDFEDVLDPFEIGDDWFELEFVFMQVRAAPHLADDVRAQVEATIDRLKLNDEECCAARAEWYEWWRREDLSDDFMSTTSPFVFREAHRQQMAP